MEIIKQVFGIDISMDSFVFRIGIIKSDQETEIGSHKEFKNNLQEIKQFFKYSQKQKLKGVTQYFLMEATGVYYETLAYFLKSKGTHVIVILPNKAKYFGKTLEIKSKTDALDAYILTQMGLDGIDKINKNDDIAAYTLIDRAGEATPDIAIISGMRWILDEYKRLGRIRRRPLITASELIDDYGVKEGPEVGKALRRVEELRFKREISRRSQLKPLL